MEIELRIAIEFILSFVVKKFKIEKTEEFVQSLLKLLTKKFEGHWYPEHPNKGSAFRCISLCDQLDAVLVKAAFESGLDVKKLEASLPSRLDVWIDPREVSYRIGQHGSLTHIYHEGDESVNASSEYAMAILKCSKLGDCLVTEGSKQDSESKLSQNRIQISQNNRMKNKDPNRLSPTAKCFVSRRSPTLPSHVPYTQTTATASYPPKPISNVDYSRKAFWPPASVYAPMARMQAHNYMIAQEMARFEAHLKAQRTVLHAHYYPTPFHYIKHLPGYYPLGQVKAANQNSGNLRIQVVA